jgi:hypothetical protein
MFRPCYLQKRSVCRCDIAVALLVVGMEMPPPDVMSDASSRQPAGIDHLQGFSALSVCHEVFLLGLRGVLFAGRLVATKFWKFCGFQLIQTVGLCHAPFILFTRDLET